MSTIQSYWKFFLLEGIGLFILGLLALASPVLTTFSIEFIIGTLLIIGGIVQFYRAVMAKAGAGFLAYLAAIVTFIAGILVFSHPVISSMTLTLLLGSYFLVEGILFILYAIQWWSLLKWKGLLLNGLISLALGWLILAGWPNNSLWILGIYVGIYLLFLGLGLVMMGLALRQYHKLG